MIIKGLLGYELLCKLEFFDLAKIHLRKTFLKSFMKLYTKNKIINWIGLLINLIIMFILSMLLYRWFNN